MPAFKVLLTVIIVLVVVFIGFQIAFMGKSWIIPKPWDKPAFKINNFACGNEITGVIDVEYKGRKKEAMPILFYDETVYLSAEDVKKEIGVEDNEEIRFRYNIPSGQGQAGYAFIGVFEYSDKCKSYAAPSPAAADFIRKCAGDLLGTAGFSCGGLSSAQPTGDSSVSCSELSLDECRQHPECKTEWIGDPTTLAEICVKA